MRGTIRRWLGIPDVSTAETTRHEAKPAHAAMAGTDLLEREDYGFRQVGGSAGQYDITAYKQRKAQMMCRRLWLENPLARILVDLELSLMIGRDGFRVSSPDPRLDRVLHDYWNHPRNAWDQFLRGYLLDLALYGEWCMPASVHAVTGQVLLGYVNPSSIVSVRKDPKNQKFDGKIRIPSGNMDASSKTLEVIRYQGDGDPKLKGDAFFFRVNSTISMSRGVPDLYPLVDWIEGHDRVLFDQMERVGLMNAFIWDVELRGLGQAEIDEWVKKNGRPPRPGSLRAHNESVKWEQQGGNFQNREVSSIAQDVKRHVVGGRGLPEHWFGWGSQTSLATADKMDENAVRVLSDRQGDHVERVRLTCQFVKEQAIAHGLVSENEKTTIDIAAPPISESDLVKSSQAMLTTTQALALARAEGWASDEQAIKILSQFSAKLGVTVTENEIMDDLKGVSTRDLDTYRRAAQRATMAKK